MTIVENYNKILQTINTFKKETKLIVVTKGQDLSKISPLIQMGHQDFGENRVQEAYIKWQKIILSNPSELKIINTIQYHMINTFREFIHLIKDLNLQNELKLFIEQVKVDQKNKKIPDISQNPDISLKYSELNPNYGLLC